MLEDVFIESDVYMLSNLFDSLILFLLLKVNINVVVQIIINTMMFGDVFIIFSRRKVYFLKKNSIRSKVTSNEIQEPLVCEIRIKL